MNNHYAHDSGVRDSLSGDVQVSEDLISGETNIASLLRTLQQPANMDARNHTRARCLPGTREDVIGSIMSWATSPSVEHNVFWLYGLGGSGKSTISLTIADLLDKEGHLGAFVSFDRHFPQWNDPSAVIRTLACQLSSARPGIATAISAIVEEVPTIRYPSISLQFQRLIVLALSSEAALSTGVQPLVLVLDAFDECGPSNIRRDLLELFAKQSAFLPSEIRIFITSRPEKDIREAFVAQSSIFSQELDTRSQENIRDIASYFRYRLGLVKQERPLAVGFRADWPEDDVIAKLTERASGLFAWASIASEFINDYDPRNRIATLLKYKPISEADAALNLLYTLVLWSVSDWGDEMFTEDFRSIVGLTLVARVPLPTNMINTYTLLHGPLKDTLDQLDSIITSKPAVRILHSSFSDFITNPRFGHDIWHINPQTFHRKLAERCLSRLDDVLKRNICRLSLTDIEYDCTFWIEHVVAIEEDAVLLMEYIKKFLRQHLLHWFEAMSILQRSRETIISLAYLLDWVIAMTSSSDEQGSLVHFVRDACRFAQVFARSIEDHPLLVYQMAHSSTPSNSPIYQAFCTIPPVPQTLGSFQRSPLLLSLSYDTTEDIWVGMYSVSFSPDGRWVASASADMTIRVWDVESGAEILPALRGHEDDVRSVAFSPDGKYIASGSEDKTIRLWDTSSGAEVQSEMRGHSGCVHSVAFSPDGTRVVSGSADFTARVWDVISRTEPPLILQGHEGKINSVAFSPDGTCIASGSNDTTVRVWDPRLGVEVVLALRGHSGDVTSTAFSPDSSRIASGSYDATIRIWDAITGEAVSILHCNAGFIFSVSYSPDGRHVLSGSYDDTIRTWDVESGMEIAPPLQGHGIQVIYVTYSPDGKRIASSGGFGEPTVQVWDASPCEIRD